MTQHKMTKKIITKKKKKIPVKNHSTTSAEFMTSSNTDLRNRSKTGGTIRILII